MKHEADEMSRANNLLLRSLLTTNQCRWHGIGQVWIPEVLQQRGCGLCVPESRLNRIRD